MKPEHPRTHTPVLPAETHALLAPALDAAAEPVILDCTAGLAGHAAALARHPATPPTVVLVDLDPHNLARAEHAVADARPDARVVTIHANFTEAPRRLLAHNLHANAVLADLGFASTQTDDPARGFAFRHDGPLDMRYDTRSPTTAAHLVNSLPEHELAEIIRDFGEERAANRVAAAIAAARAQSPITTTTQLAQTVRAALPNQSGSKQRPRPHPRNPAKPAIDPATKTFQALRIAVNDELAALDTLLESVSRGALAARANPAQSWLAPDARIAVISFHSLEDRRVKQAFKSLADRALASSLTRRPIAASPEETSTNRRARSARLRAVQLTA